MQCLSLDEGAGFQRSRPINTPTLSPLRYDKPYSRRRHGEGEAAVVATPPLAAPQRRRGGGESDRENSIEQQQSSRILRVQMGGGPIISHIECRPHIIKLQHSAHPAGHRHEARAIIPHGEGLSGGWPDGTDAAPPPRVLIISAARRSGVPSCRVRALAEVLP
jgi:hypothetical protein